MYGGLKRTMTFYIYVSIDKDTNIQVYSIHKDAKKHDNSMCALHVHTTERTFKEFSRFEEDDVKDHDDQGNPQHHLKHLAILTLRLVNPPLQLVEQLQQSVKPTHQLLHLVYRLPRSTLRW